ncbi:MAG: hypothetical protein MJE77_33480 [Proteobacteria bacterium]|nr:hypothetical protein [Pseudomonadota bacterium]
MPRGSEKANEFKRYRQILAALYIGTITAGFLLLAASVVNELFFRPAPTPNGPVLSGDDPDNEALMHCHRSVAGLYDELGGIAAQLLALPGQSQKLTPHWMAFSERWMRQWDRVAVQCRFSELADTHMGEAYDRMARVHRELPTIRLKYQSLLVRFDEQQAADLSRAKRDLDRSRELLLRVMNSAGEEAP